MSKMYKNCGTSFKGDFSVQFTQTQNLQFKVSLCKLVERSVTKRLTFHKCFRVYNFDLFEVTIEDSNGKRFIM